MKKNKNNKNLPTKQPGKIKKLWKKILVGLGFAGMFAGAATSISSKNEKEVEADYSKKIEAGKLPDVKYTDLLLKRGNHKVEKEVETTQPEQVATEAVDRVYSDANKQPETVKYDGELSGDDVSFYPEESVEETIVQETKAPEEMEVIDNNPVQPDAPKETITVENVDSLQEQVTKENGEKTDIKIGLEIEGEEGKVKYNEEENKIEYEDSLDNKAEVKPELSNDENGNGEYDVGEGETEFKRDEAVNPFESSSTYTYEELATAAETKWANEEETTKEQEKNIEDDDLTR